ncbi:MAG: FecR domain-containing protein [Verrucomicrobia bacterium]|nr:FecR domain-containing protein [Verrucomicrobiota bacterium]
MTPPRDPSSPDILRLIDDAAAAWVARRDRGLTAVEQDEFLQWLSADPRHGERLARHQRGWAELAHLALWRPEHSAEPNPDLLAPPASVATTRKVLRWAVPLSLAAAALAIMFVSSRNRPPPPAAAAPGESAYRQQVLDDGTLVELNRGAQFSATFTPGERRVRLTHGEALFTVAKNPARPFVVEAGGVTVRAVGTAFNVRLGPAEVEVLVTEGRVQLDRPAAPLATPPLGAAGQRAVVPRSGAEPVTAAVTRDEIDRALAWQPKLLEFAATPLADVAAEFNRRNRLQLIVADEALRALPIGASFRSDNVDGFVRLLEASFGVSVERSRDTITLRRAR